MLAHRSKNRLWMRTATRMHVRCGVNLCGLQETLWHICIGDEIVYFSDSQRKSGAIRGNLLPSAIMIAVLICRIMATNLPTGDQHLHPVRPTSIFSTLRL